MTFLHHLLILCCWRGHVFRDVLVSRMVNPDLDGLEGKWDKDTSLSQDEQLKIPTDSRLYAVMVRTFQTFPL